MDTIQSLRHSKNTVLADDEFLRLGLSKINDDTVCDVQTNIVHLKGEVGNC
jgi:hypothetical protein